MIVHIKNPKSSKNKKYLRTNKQLWFAGYKIKVQKSTAFLHTSNEQFIFETKKHNTIYISTQKRKKKKNT